MLKLSDINDQVKHHVRRDDFDIMADARIALTNFVMRRFAALTNWEDFTQISTRMSTAAVTATYTWAPGPTFQDILGIYIQDGDDGDKEKRVVPVRSIQVFYEHRRKAAGFPEVYRFYRLADETKIVEFAPMPKWGGKTIKVDGVIEPDPFISEEQRTLFSIAGLDDAYALTLAGFFTAKDGQQPRAAQLFSWASDQIRLNTGKEIKADEIRESLML